MESKIVVPSEAQRLSRDISSDPRIISNVYVVPAAARKENQSKSPGSAISPPARLPSWRVVAVSGLLPWSSGPEGVGIGVAVGTAVGVAVGTGVAVGATVGIGVAVGNAVGIAVAVEVGTGVGTRVGAAVGVAVGNGAGAVVAVGAGVDVAVG